MSALPSLSVLQWRCRRGTLELDALLGRFLQQRYPHLSHEQKLAFVALLACDDEQLQAALLGGAPVVDPAWAELVRLMTQGFCDD